MNEAANVLVSEAELASAARRRAQAEAAEWATMLAYSEAREAAIRSADRPTLIRECELSFIAHDIGQAMGFSDGQATARLATARRVREQAPAVWAAFVDGRIDAARVWEISGAVERLERAESVARLDRQVVGYAERHTTAELRRWLKVFIARVESDLFTERAEAERTKRRVEIVHGDDGMSWMNLYGESFKLAAIDQRLTKEAKAFGDADERTLEQRRFDLAAAWLTTNEAGEAAVHAHIAVTMPGSAVAGATDHPAVAADGTWLAPTAWMLDLAKHHPDNVFWHRMILDPVADDVLAIEYRGRFAPAVLAQAIEFRDGVCRAPGCCKPAHLCDIDHRIPHAAGGPTTASNLQPLCRKHHKAKGFGLLMVKTPSTAPPLHHVGHPDVPVEQRLTHLLSGWADDASRSGERPPAALRLRRPDALPRHGGTGRRRPGIQGP